MHYKKVIHNTKKSRILYWVPIKYTMNNLDAIYDFILNELRKLTLNENNLPENTRAKVMTTAEVNSTTKNSDSIIINQTIEEKDPVKTPIKW